MAITDPYAAANARQPGLAQEAGAYRGLGQQGISGLSDLMNTDTSAQRAGIQGALLQAQAEPISTAYDRQRQALLEGTFGHGVGNSTMQTELQGRLAQEYNDSLARAGLSAYTGAGAEQRADLASQQGLDTSAISSSLAGEGAANNLDLAYQQLGQQGTQYNQGLEQQGSQFGQNLAQQGQQFQQQLGQQGAQYGQGLAQQENLLNKQIQNQQELQNNNLLFSGIGGGLSGLAQLFGPTLASIFPAVARNT